MLDETLIKFVEPIGPGQIIDRESLVALPAGLIQMTIQVKHTEVTVRVLAMKEESLVVEDATILNWHASAFIWQNGEVIAAEKMDERLVKTHAKPARSKTLPRISHVTRRRTQITPKSFRFVREASDQVENTSVVDAILQICIYKYQSGGTQKKTFVGTVNVALNYLTSEKCQNLNPDLACDGDWFKVFPKSSFIPGCPRSIAKSNCVISGQNNDTETAETESMSVSRSHSTTSFKHVGLKRSQSQSSSISSSRSSETGRPRTKTDPNPTVTHRIASWVKQTVFRQKYVPTEKKYTARTPEAEVPDSVFTLPSVIIGPIKRQTADQSTMTSIPETHQSDEQLSSTSTAPNKPDHLFVPEQLRPNVYKTKLTKFRTSRSNNSSFDVGYESGRSRYLSSSDEELSYKSAESNLDALCEKDAEIDVVTQKPPGDECFQMEIINEKGKIMPAKRKKPLSLKERQSTLQRSTRISCDDGFTSLTEMQRRGSRGSHDSAIFANA